MDSSAAGLDRVVVIGASAGGLEAIQELLGPLPPGGTATYVVAQHLAPEHPSQLVELLRRCTRLPVVAATDLTPLQPGQIVVLPPNCDASFDGDSLRLVPPEPRFGPSPSIDAGGSAVWPWCSPARAPMGPAGCGRWAVPADSRWCRHPKALASMACRGRRSPWAVWIWWLIRPPSAPSSAPGSAAAATGPAAWRTTRRRCCSPAPPPS